jgi:hypothetical protein
VLPYQQAGMTLRDFFAAHALESDIDCYSAVLTVFTKTSDGRPFSTLPDNWRAKARYMHADAMLKAREAV